MIYSMTGFAAAAAELDAGSLALELRSVNHRYLDLQLRMPDELRTLEPALREAIATQLTHSCQGNPDPLRLRIAAHSAPFQFRRNPPVRNEPKKSFVFNRTNLR